MSEEMRVRYKAMTTRALIIAIVYMVLLTIVYNWADVVAHDLSKGLPIKDRVWWPIAFGERYGATGLFAPMLAMLIPLYLLNRVLPVKKRLSAAEIAFILSAVILVPVLASESGYGIVFQAKAAAVGYVDPDGRYMEKFLSPLWFPTDYENILAPMKVGGAPVPWAAWTVPIIFQIAFFCVLRVFFFFGSALVAQQYIETEGLAFPITAVLLNEMVNISAKEGKNRILGAKSSKRIAIVAFAIGLIIYFLKHTYLFWPALGTDCLLPYAHSYGGETGAPQPFQIDLTKVTALTGNVAPLLINFDIHTIAVFLLLPLDVSVSTFATYAVIYMIMPPILVALGWIVPGGPTNFWGGAVRAFNGNRELPYWEYGYRPVMLGFTIGVALIPLIQHRRIIVASIKSAIRGEQYGWFSPRIMWGGWALSGLATILLISATGVPIHYSFYVLFITSVFYLAMTRFAAASGAFWLHPQPASYAGYRPYIGFSNLGLWHFGLVGQETAATYNSVFIGHELLYNPGMGSGLLCNPMTWHLEEFKLTELNNIDRRDMSIGMLIGSLLPIFIIIPLSIWLNYTYGWENHSPAEWSAGRALRYAYRVTQGRPGEGGAGAVFTNPWQPSIYSYAYLILGIVLVWVIGLARTRIGGITRYISIYGVLFAFVSMWQAWLPCLIVSIIHIVVRYTGGTRMYEEKILPIALGVAVSLAVGWAAGLFCDTLRGLGYVWWA